MAEKFTHWRVMLVSEMWRSKIIKRLKWRLEWSWWACSSPLQSRDDESSISQHENLKNNARGVSDRSNDRLLLTDSKRSSGYDWHAA